jgi:hypothetical protein
MNAEPGGLATLQPLTPPALERVVKKCLAKHPDDRWDTAHDVADELRWIAQVSGATADARPRRGLGRQAAIAAGVLLVGISIGASVLALLRPAAPGVALARPSVDVRPAEELNAGGVSQTWAVSGGSRTALTWTPDGQALVFVGRKAGVQQLYVRRLDEAEARSLPGTEGAQAPAVSADGQWLAFWVAGAVKKIPLAGGPVMDLVAGVASPPRGLVWDGAGRVYFGNVDGRIWQIPPDGAAAAVTTLGEAERAHTLPCPLPSNQALLYTVRKRTCRGATKRLSPRFSRPEHASSC